MHHRSLLAPLVLLLLAAASCASAPREAWIKNSQVTVYRVRMTLTGSNTKPFSGYPVTCATQLTDPQRDQLVHFLFQAEQRQARLEAEAVREGKVAGGVIGSIGMRYAIEFRSPTRTVEAYVCNQCQRLDGFPIDSSFRFLFTPEEARWLDSFLEAFLAGCAGGA